MSHILKTPTNLPQLVTSAFTRARAGNDLNFFPTQVAVLETGSAQVQLRYAPSLANKPKAPKPAPGSTPFDPFATPPAALRITDVSSSHYLILNKFSVAPEHFILATTDWKSQEDVLEAEDIEAATACIQAYVDKYGGNISEEEAKLAGSQPVRQGVFVFFNGGPNSGASQPHRHLQLLPISSFYEGLPADTEWRPLISTLQTPEAVSKLPFRIFTAEISLGMSKEELFKTYLELYTTACKDVLSAEAADAIPATGKSIISYNFAMTRERMVVCPRLNEGAEIDLESGGQGKVQLNGTLLAGTVLVKNKGEWDALISDSKVLHGVLEKIGVSGDTGTLRP